MQDNNKKKRIAIFISGRGSNMKAILDNVCSGMLKDVCDVSLVFSNNPDAKGLKIAADYGIKTAVIDSSGKKRKVFDQQVVDLLSGYNLDYIVLAGYMRILSPVLVDAYEDRIVNIHPADTLQYQGLHGYEWAWNNKLKSTKITVHLVDKGVDTGQILSQVDVDLSDLNSLDEVEQKGLSVEHEFYSKVLYTLFNEM